MHHVRFIVHRDHGQDGNSSPAIEAGEIARAVPWLMGEQVSSLIQCYGETLAAQSNRIDSIPPEVERSDILQRFILNAELETAP